MRWLLVVAVIALSASAAFAQSPVNQEGISNYCYYGGQLYSIGSRLCISGAKASSAMLLCESADQAKDVSKTGRAVWIYNTGEGNPSCK
jgi:hypothetical protein